MHDARAFLSLWLLHASLSSRSSASDAASAMAP